MSAPTTPPPIPYSKSAPAPQQSIPRTPAQSRRLWELLTWLIIGLALSGSVILLRGSLGSLAGQNVDGHSGLAQFGHLGGAAATVALYRGYAYVGTAGELTVLDISDPIAPVRVGFVSVSNTDLVVDATRLVVAAKDGIHFLDLANPAQPNRLGTYATRYPATGIAAAGDFIYAVDHFGGLYVFGGTSAGLPPLVTYLALRETSWTVGARPGVAYVGTDRGLLVVDVSPGASPRLVNVLPTHGAVHDIALSDDYLYAAGVDGVAVYALGSELRTPMWVAHVPLSASAWGITVAQPFVYVALGTLGLGVIDHTHAAAPFLAGLWDSPGVALDVTVGGPYAYVAQIDRGVDVVDIRTPSSPMSAGAFRAPGFIWAVALVDDYAYIVADWTGNLHVIDIADRAWPIEVAEVHTSGDAWDVVAANGYLYVADGFHGLGIYAIADPDHPILVGVQEELPGYAQSVMVDGTTAYVGLGENGIYIVDVSVPARPAIIGAFAPGRQIADQVIAGRYLYVGTTNVGTEQAGTARRRLTVLDVQTPSRAQIVTHLDGLEEIRALHVAGDYLLVAAGVAGLGIVDVRDPRAPRIVGTFDTPGRARDVVVIHRRAYVAVERQGVWVLDICDVTQPQFLGTIATADAVFALAASDDFVFLCERAAGFSVIGPIPGE